MLNIELSGRFIDRKESVKSALEQEGGKREGKFVTYRHHHRHHHHHCDRHHYVNVYEKVDEMAATEEKPKCDRKSPPEAHTLDLLPLSPF